MRWLGVRSYGIYLLYVGIVILVAPHLHGLNFYARAGILIVFGLIFSVALAGLSFRFVEQLFLRLRHGWRPTEAHVKSLSGT